jgi:type I restriction enzyme, R subunit
MEVNFFLAIRAFIVKVERDGMPDVGAFKEKITAMIEEAVMKDGDEVISITGKKEKSLLSAENLEKIAKMNRKNMASEILKKLLEDKIKYFKKTNLAKSIIFSEKLKVIVETYNQVQDIEVLITEMIDMAKEIEYAINEGAELNLTAEEMAFYDALAKPELVKVHYASEVLKEIAKELLKLIKENKTPNWHKRDDARANMRALIRRLLKIHKYPPDEVEGATEFVIQQAELQMENE